MAQPRAAPSAAALAPLRRGRPPQAARWTVDEIMARLGPLYGPVNAPRGYDALSELIYTVLSQHTSDANSTRAYAALKAAFPTWEAVIAAPAAEVALAIRNGGLAQVKAPRIQSILREVKGSTGKLDLSFLSQLPMDEAKAWLRQLPGVGPKTAGCVLLFSAGHPAMVVDTHVYRVAQRLGLYGPRVNAEQSHDVLETLVPPGNVLPFHMYLIQHGRRVCKAQQPRCAACVLEPKCPSSRLKPRNRARLKAATASKRGARRLGPAPSPEKTP